MRASKLRLGVNIDHVATLRNARGILSPDPVRAALVAEEAGADGITAHLREDRRHITDSDIAGLKSALRIPLNFEMAATPEMVDIALRIRPHACCLVPEKREERTTEGGLNVLNPDPYLKEAIAKLAGAGIKVSLFIEPDLRSLEESKKLGAPVVEFHTGRYCESSGAPLCGELKRLQESAAYAETIGLECHAGHGLSFDTVGPIAAIPQIQELNIGHFLIGEAVFSGLNLAIQSMRELMEKARSEV